MARAAWKYYYFISEDFLYYGQWLVEDYSNLNRKQSSRFKTIHRLNYIIPTTIYTGKWVNREYLTKFHFGFKLGELSKTRKPYYFRSKKKR